MYVRLISFLFLDGLGVSWTFISFSIICAISVLFIFSFVPETKNRTLEQVSSDMKARYTISCILYTVEEYIAKSFSKKFDGDADVCARSNQLLCCCF